MISERVEVNYWLILEAKIGDEFVTESRFYPDIFISSFEVAFVCGFPNVSIVEFEQVNVS